MENQDFTPFQSSDDLSHFRNLVRIHLAGEGYSNPVFEDWFVTLDPSIEQKLGTWNLAQGCAQSSKEDWEGIISSHFEKVFHADSESQEYESKKGRFEDIKDQLRLQLYPENYLDGIDIKEEVVYRTDIPGTLSVLVIDLPSNIVTLRRSDANIWNISEDELFQVALSNTLKSVETEHSVQDGGEVDLHVIAGEDILSAVSVFNLKKVKDCVGTHGAIVSIPTRHFIISYPIEDLSVVKAIQAVAVIASGMNQAGPGSLSPLIYWYKDGVFKNQTYSIEGDKFNFAPDEEFISVLNLLK